MSIVHDSHDSVLNRRDEPKRKGWLHRFGELINANWRDKGAAQRVQATAGTSALLLAASAVVISVVLEISVGAAAGAGRAVGVTSFLIIAAATMVGAALGFLFGLPRTRNEAAAEESVVNAAHHAGAASRLARAFAANDNLTKVSDWLTTIVVGLTLINLSSLQGAVAQLADVLQDALGGGSGSGTIGICLVIIGLVAGFIAAYLWTSVSVRAILEESEAFKDYMQSAHAFGGYKEDRAEFERMQAHKVHG
jgi:hypothetical protein